jgi:hypothetical protein
MGGTMRQWKPCVVLALTLTSVGCVDSYKEPDQTANLATANFIKGYDTHFGQGGAQAYGISVHDDCTESQKIAVLGALSGDRETAHLIASHPVVIFAYTSISQGVGLGYPLGVGLKTAICANKFRFLPQEGHVYDIKQSSSMNGICAIGVTDNTTGASLTTMTVSDAPACENPDVWK